MITSDDFLQSLVAALRPVQRIIRALPKEVPDDLIMMGFEVPDRDRAELYARDLRRIGRLLSQWDQAQEDLEETQPIKPLVDRG